MKKALLLLTMLAGIGFSASATLGPCTGMPMNPAVTTQDTSICVGNVINLMGTDPNASSVTGITYQWEKSTTLTGTYTAVTGGSGATTLAYTTPAIAATTFYRVTASCGANKAASTPIIVAASSNTTPTVSAATAATTLCQGTAANFTANASADTGATPQYKWYVNGANVATGKTYSYTPANKDTVTVVLTPSNMCVTSPTITSSKVGLTVNAPAPANVTVTTSSPLGRPDSACAGGAVAQGTTLTASGNGGPSATYVWYKRRGSAAATVIPGTGNTVTYNAASVTSIPPVAYDTVWAIMTTSDACATTTTATSPHKTVTIIGGKNPAASPNGVLMDSVCTGTTYLITATPNYTSSRDSYQWVRNGATVGSGSSYSFVASRPTYADSIYVIFTSSYLCPATAGPAGLVYTSSTKNVFARPAITSVVTLNTITPSDTVCAGTQVTVTATGTLGGQLPLYTWTKNGRDVANGTLYTYTATPGVDTISIRMVTDMACATAPFFTAPNKDILTVRPTAVSASILASQNDTVCAGTPVTFMAMGANGGTAPTYQWLKNGVKTGATDTYSYTASMNDTVSLVYTSNAACASAAPTDSVSTMLMVNPLPAKPVITIMGRHLMSSGTYDAYNWYLNDTLVATTTGAMYAPAQDGVYTVSVSDSNSCTNTSDTVRYVTLGVKNVTSNNIAVKIYPNPATDVINISAPVNVHAVIYGIEGKVVLDQPNATQLNISNLASGMYIIKVSDASGNVLRMGKIVKENK